MSVDDIAIKVSNLSKCYQIYDKPHDRLKQSIYPRLQRLAGKLTKQYFREFWALKDGIGTAFIDISIIQDSATSARCGTDKMKKWSRHSGAGRNPVGFKQKNAFLSCWIPA